MLPAMSRLPKLVSRTIERHAAQALARTFPMTSRTLAFSLANLTLLVVTLAILFGQAGLHQTHRVPARLHVAAPRTIVRAVIRPAAPRQIATIPDPEAALSRAQLIDRWQPLIAKAARRFTVPQAWIRAVMLQESGGRTKLNGQPIVSHAGAMGLMQLLPETYREMRIRYRLGADVFNPRDNIFAGTAYLKDLRKQYGFPALFAAYNAGPRQLDNRLADGRALPAETQSYVEHVGRMADPTAVKTGEGIWENYLRLRREALMPKPPSTLNEDGRKAAELATLSPEGQEAARLAALPVKGAPNGP